LDSNIIGRTTIDPSSIVEGSRLIVGNKQVEVRACTNVYVVDEKI